MSTIKNYIFYFLKQKERKYKYFNDMEDVVEFQYWENRREEKNKKN